MKIPLLIVMAITSWTVSSKELPEGWGVGGTNPEGYDIKVVEDMGDHPPVASIQSNTTVKAGEFTTLMQKFYPKDFIGRRMKMSVLIKSENVTNWAGAWVRIDGINGHVLAFDNMKKRPIVGTTDWQKYEIVLDVSEETESLHFGVLLGGEGKVWMDDFTFETVTKDIPVTNMLSRKPKQAQANKYRNQAINKGF